MSKKNSMYKKIALTLSILTISACTSITEVNRFSHGYAPSIKEVENFKQNKATQTNIANEIGKPFVIGTYDKNYWYYISYSTEQYGFSKKEYVKFTVVELQFKNGVLFNTKRYNKDTLNKIAFNTKKTNASGKELGVFEQMLGNIGKFKPKPKGTQ